MGKVRRTFTIEFKQAVVAQLLSGQATFSQLCREHQLAVSVLRRWKMQEETGTLSGASLQKEHHLERENRFLKEKLAELYLQVELLKKVQTAKRWETREFTSIITRSNLAPSRGGAR